MKRDLAFLVISAASILLSYVAPGVLPFDWGWIAIMLCGLPIVLNAVVALITEFDIKADVLVSLALIASIAIGEYAAAGIVAFIMQLGGFLEESTVHRARSGLEKLAAAAPHTARIVEEGSEHVVDARTVAAGALVRVLPGETIPVDGIVQAGATSVDASIMTGESIPVDVAAGDEVVSGSVNQLGSIDIVASRAGDDSSIVRMAQLARSVDAEKAHTVRTADAWATWIVVVAASISVACFLVTGEVIRAVTVLVVLCPCALVLATPTAVMAAIGNATKHGFLTREGDALERLAQVTHVAFDKTGTLTNGTPEVVEVAAAHGSHLDADEVFELAASAERRSEHPLGRAIATEFARRSGREASDPDSFELLLGRGVSASVGGTSVLVGNGPMMADASASVPPDLLESAARHAAKGRTTVYVCRGDRVEGLVALADTVRPESAAAVAALKRKGLVPVLLTGDNERAAAAIASELGIEEVHAGCLPDAKLAWIKQTEETGARVCMVGDGVNDAPSLACAHVGIAMGGVGSDIAVESSDIVAVNDSIGELGHLVGLSRRTLGTIKAGIAFSMCVNIAATLLATLGVLGPVGGAIVHNVGSVLVIVNSALLLGWKER